MNIDHIEHGSKGAFIIKENNQGLAEMTYCKAGDRLIIIAHTEVSDALRRKGRQSIGERGSKLCKRKEYQNTSALPIRQSHI